MELERAIDMRNVQHDYLHWLQALLEPFLPMTSINRPASPTNHVARLVMVTEQLERKETMTRREPLGSPNEMMVMTEQLARQGNMTDKELFGNMYCVKEKATGTEHLERHGNMTRNEQLKSLELGQLMVMKRKGPAIAEQPPHAQNLGMLEILAKVRETQILDLPPRVKMARVPRQKTPRLPEVKVARRDLIAGLRQVTMANLQVLIANLQRVTIVDRPGETRVLIALLVCTIPTGTQHEDQNDLQSSQKIPKGHPGHVHLRRKRTRRLRHELKVKSSAAVSKETSWFLEWSAL